MDSLRLHVEALPESWKWDALFVPMEGFEREWRSWLAQAQLAEERALLAWWARRPAADDRDDDQDRLAAA